MQQIRLHTHKCSSLSIQYITYSVCILVSVGWFIILFMCLCVCVMEDGVRNEYIYVINVYKRASYIRISNNKIRWCICVSQFVLSQLFDWLQRRLYIKQCESFRNFIICSIPVKIVAKLVHTKIYFVFTNIYTNKTLT